MCSGVKGIFTAHGDCLEELRLNNQLERLIDKRILERIVFLDKENRGNIKEVYVNGVNGDVDF